MSCLSCPCHFKWPVDTMGIKRDPINCEKAWLDFAVRLLSREAVGKGRGQETVWGARCKPSWWDRKVGHPWKNPTANPKDTKEVLLEKYVALESHLREEKRFPVELEEESRLWKEGKYRELFLMTSLTSLLGKVTSVHTAVEDACVKVNELKASVHQSILTNIQNCLTSSLKATQQLNYAQSKTNSTDIDTKTNTKKRTLVSSGLQKENTEFPPAKQKKLQPQSENLQKASNSKLCHADRSANSDMQPTDILAFAQKLIAKRKSHAPKLSANDKKRSNISTPLPPREILPKIVAPKVSEPILTTPFGIALHSSEQSLASFTSSKAVVDNSHSSFTSVPHSSQQTLTCSTITPLLGNSASVCPVTITPDQLSSILSQEPATKLSHTDQSLNTGGSDPAFELAHCITFQPTKSNICYDEFELGEKLTFDSLNSINFDNLNGTEGAAINPSIDSHSIKLKTPVDVQGMTDHVSPNEVSPTESHSSSMSCVGNSITPSPHSSDADFDLSFLNNEDIEKFCNEIFKESSNDADPAFLSSLGAGPINSQNCLQSVNQNDTENDLHLNFYCSANESLNEKDEITPLPFSEIDLISATNVHSRVETRALSSSSSDHGYCSEGSPPHGTSSNSLQKNLDEDPSFLLDRFLLENPCSFDLD